MLAALTEIEPYTPTPWHIGPRPPDGSDDEQELAPGVTVNWRNRANLTRPPLALFGGEQWHSQARCFSAGSQLFFDSDDTDGPQLKPTVLARAQALCRGCPVAAHCLRTALQRNERYGVWAGSSGRQRDKMRARINHGESLDDVVVSWLARL